jgi:hypothetical protein
MSELFKYWIFAAVCLVVAIVLLRLVLRERLMLQGSVSYLSFLGILGLMAVFPDQTQQLARAMGFTLLSNFFFSVSIGVLALLHLRALITVSKVHMRTVALTQELAIVQERLERALADRGRPVSGADLQAAERRA